MTGSAKEAQGGGKLYEIVRDELIDAIKSGAYAPGALLPSVREMTVRWTVSTTTARKVLSELVASGWARSQGTKGYVVTIPAQGEATSAPEGKGAASAAPITGLSAIRSPQVVPVDGAVKAASTATDLRLEPPPVEVLHALRMTDSRARVTAYRRLAVDGNGKPIQLRVSYTALNITEGTSLASSEAIHEAWIDTLATHFQKKSQLTESFISARHPNDTEAAMLELAPTACVLVRVEVLADAKGKPIVVTMTIWPGDTTRIDVMNPVGAK